MCDTRKITNFIYFDKSGSNLIIKAKSESLISAIKNSHDFSLLPRQVRHDKILLSKDLYFYMILILSDIANINTTCSKSIINDVNNEYNNIHVRVER